MQYIKLVFACAAMLASWLCFGVQMPVQEPITDTTEAYTAETDVLLDAIPEETVEAVMEAVGTGMLYTPMAGRHLDDMPLPLPDEEAADAESVPMPAARMADDTVPAEDDRLCLDAEDTDTERVPYHTVREVAEANARREAREAQQRAEEEARRRAEEAAERRRRAAEAKAAHARALREACPGYDAQFVSTLTEEERAEAEYFYEQGYVFYRQNWSSVKDAEYGDCGFGQCGCGPTCIAAIISNLAGVPVDPEEMRVYGLSVGSWLPSGGTTYGFLIETAKKYGITASQIYASDKEALFDALRDENKLVLATMGPGDFTLGAHFMLFRGITDEGKILIADSYSFEHSVREWDYDELYAQLKTGYWIFEKTE